ncbi:MULTISPECIES: GNAT family N-acetyltransferase [unclassified Lysobacter]|uniref:GNAT family N-acetyltransferase n=1 Tax=unclassified Lysobacter TaxID=2635362 RepID=UPI0006F89DC5|nr:MULTISPECIES: GNAT family N-acetyltransferase [unclassified Lysobacter]KRA14439.1 acetyltransferase [Lysobacter sp. Root604]KRD30247.1 acetyltransferase [Lysobacter sp. Root916]
MPVTVRRAYLDDLDALAPLFDRYRHFYTQRYDEAVSRAFIAQRLQREESVVFLAELDGAPAGFTQLYPSFSSVRAARVWVLNDLFVEADARRRGVAQALLNAAAEFARTDGAVRLELETDPDNATAQALYDASGWHRYDGTLRYHLPLSAA